MTSNDAEVRGWLLSEVKKLRRELKDGKATQESLDDLVHEVASKHATEVNNGGISAQLTYLLHKGISPKTIKQKCITH